MGRGDKDVKKLVMKTSPLPLDFSEKNLLAFFAGKRNPLQDS
jgi:hypothetical protein